mgnify:FL=1
MEKYYYVNAQRQTVGPFTISQLAAEGIRPETLVWCEGMPEWLPAGNVTALQNIFYSTVPPMPGNRNVAANQPVGSPQLERPQTYLWLGILTTILCCLPFGIVSIVYASKVDSYWLAGNYEAARDSSIKARNWGIASAVSAAVIYFIYFGVLGASLASIYSL